MTHDDAYSTHDARFTIHDSRLDPPPSPSRARSNRRHRQTARHPLAVSPSSRRSMVAYVMDDERMIKSAWTPEVRAIARASG